MERRWFKREGIILVDKVGMSGIGKRIQEIRKKKNLTQKEFASVIGTTDSYISAIEKKGKIPSEMFVRLVSLKFDIDIEWLITGNGTVSSMLSLDESGSVKAKSIMEQMREEAEYAQRSLIRDLLCEIYGKAKMAYQLGAISFEELMEINHMTVYFINTHANEVR